MLAALCSDQRKAWWKAKAAVWRREAKLFALSRAGIEAAWVVVVLVLMTALSVHFSYSSAVQAIEESFEALVDANVEIAGANTETVLGLAGGIAAMLSSALSRTWAPLDPTDAATADALLWEMRTDVFSDASGLAVAVLYANGSAAVASVEGRAVQLAEGDADASGYAYSNGSRAADASWTAAWAPREEPWYAAAVSSAGEVAWSTPYASTLLDGTSVVAVSQAVAMGGGEFATVLVELPTGTISGASAGVRLDEDAPSSVFVVALDGTIVADSASAGSAGKNALSESVGAEVDYVVAELVAEFGSLGDFPATASDLGVQPYEYVDSGPEDTTDGTVFRATKLRVDLQNANNDWILCTSVDKGVYFDNIQHAKTVCIVLSVLLTLVVVGTFFAKYRDHKGGQELSMVEKHEDMAVVPLEDVGIALSEVAPPPKHVASKGFVAEGGGSDEEDDDDDDEAESTIRNLPFQNRTRVASTKHLTNRQNLRWSLWNEWHPVFVLVCAVAIAGGSHFSLFGQAGDDVDALLDDVRLSLADGAYDALWVGTRAPLVVAKQVYLEHRLLGVLDAADAGVDAPVDCDSWDTPDFSLAQGVQNYFLATAASAQLFSRLEYVGAGFEGNVAVWGFEGEQLLLSDQSTLQAEDSTSQLVYADSGDVIGSPYFAPDRPWYASCVDGTSGELLWTDLYTYVATDVELGADVCVRFEWASADGNSTGLVGVLDLATSTSLLAEDALSFPESIDARILVTEVSSHPAQLLETTVVASAGEDFTRSGDRTFANESTDATLQGIVLEINARIDGQLDWDRKPKYPDGAETDSVSMTVLYGAETSRTRTKTLADDFGLRWRVMASYVTYAFTDELFDWRGVNVLICFACIASTLLLLSVVARPRTSDWEHLEQFRKTDWTALAASLESEVMLPGGWDATRRAAWSYVHHSFRRAESHCLDQLNVERRVGKHSLPEPLQRFWDPHNPDQWVKLLAKKNLYYVVSHPWWTRVANAAVWAHLLCGFWEAPAYGSSDPNYYTEYGSGLASITLLVILVHIAHLLLTLGARGFFTRSRRDATTERLSYKRMFHVLIVGTLVADWFAAAVVGYRVEQSYELYMPTLLPRSAVLRPVLFFFVNRPFARAAENFFATLLRARELLIVSVSFMAVVSGVFITLLAGVEYDDEALGRNVEDYRSAGTLVFTYLLTGENYPDVMHPAAAESKLLRIVLVGVSFVGLFILAALIIGHFEDCYSKRLEVQEAHRDTEHRLAIMVAYHLLRKARDQGAAGAPAEDPYRDFLALLGDKDHAITDKALRAAGVAAPDMDALLFVSIVERVEYHGKLDVDHYTDPQPARSLRMQQSLEAREWGANLTARYGRLRRWLRKNVKHSKYYDRVVLGVVLFNLLFLLTLASKARDSDVVYQIPNLFPSFAIAECILRMIISGPINFLTKFSPRDPYRRVSHQFDALVALFSATAYLSVAGLGANAMYVYAIPSLRVFTVVRSNKEIVFGLVLVLRHYTPFITLLVAAVYVYAVVGCQLFAGIFDFYTTDQYELKDESHFNSLSIAIATMYQLMMGEAWTSVMNAAVDQVGFSATFYFVSYVLFVGVLYAQLAVGLVLTGYGLISDFDDKMRRLSPETIDSLTQDTQMAMLVGYRAETDVRGEDMADHTPVLAAVQPVRSASDTFAAVRQLQRELRAREQRQAELEAEHQRRLDALRREHEEGLQALDEAERAKFEAAVERTKERLASRQGSS